MSDTLNSKYWIQLQDDIRPYRDKLATAADTVVDEGVSNYPIFFAYPAPEQEKSPGIFVMEVPTTNQGISWRINLTTLEELSARKVMVADRIDPFRKVYKNSPDNLCFLIVDSEGARFGFVPRDKK